FRAPGPYQGHTTVDQVEAAGRTETRRVPAGTIVVRTAQPLGTLAALFLEPQAADGLTTLNFFDTGLAEGVDFPVLRLPSAAVALTGAVRPLAEDRIMHKRITVDTVYGNGQAPNLGGNPVQIGEWLDDENYLQVRAGKLMKVHACTGKSQ